MKTTFDSFGKELKINNFVRFKINGVSNTGYVRYILPDGRIKINSFIEFVRKPNDVTNIYYIG